jgi:FkbM family methyltransferase
MQDDTLTLDEAGEAPPFGRFAPSRRMAWVIARTRAAGGGWLARRAAFALRKLGLRLAGEQPLDIETLGARMRLFPAHNLCEKRILFTPQLFDAEERAILAARIRPGFRFVDVGANVGAYALFVAAQAGPEARILAVEPQPVIFERLVANIRFNPFGTVKAVACALADKPGELTLFIDRHNSGESSVKIVGNHMTASVKVPTTTLLSLLAEEGYDRLDALKLDVEGAEDLILEPFLEQASDKLLPGLVIVENGAGRWQADLPALLARRGYREIGRTRLNLVFERG